MQLIEKANVIEREVDWNVSGGLSDRIKIKWQDQCVECGDEWNAMETNISLTAWVSLKEDNQQAIHCFSRSTRKKGNVIHISKIFNLAACTKSECCQNHIYITVYAYKKEHSWTVYSIIRLLLIMWIPLRTSLISQVVSVLEYTDNWHVKDCCRNRRTILKKCR